jgi:hypothetical protein
VQKTGDSHAQKGITHKAHAKKFTHNNDAAINIATQPTWIHRIFSPVALRRPISRTLPLNIYISGTLYMGKYLLSIQIRKKKMAKNHKKTLYY